MNEGGFSFLGLVILIAALTATPRGDDDATKPTAQPSSGEGPWWETASVYQVYPRSLQDTNDDGIGDLQGITRRLQYIRDVGYEAVWLSPIFTSPMADFGYDISNYTGIDAIFGTMADFESKLLLTK